jgi:hypothetical protein
MYRADTRNAQVLCRRRQTVQQDITIPGQQVIQREWIVRRKAHAGRASPDLSKRIAFQRSTLSLCRVTA